MLILCGESCQSSVVSLAEEKIIIKAGHGLTEYSAMHQGFLKFKEVLEDISKGQFEVKIYPNQQLGGDRELIEGSQLGNVTVAAATSAVLGAFDEDYFILDIPFMFASRKEVFTAFDGKLGQNLLSNLEKINLIGLGFWENGFRNLTNSRNPVRTADDVKGLKLRTMENAIHLAIWKTLGANPTPMAFGELFTALQQKTVDGQENPFGQIYDNKFYEVQSYITKTQHIYQPLITFINKDFFYELSPENQNLVKIAMNIATEHQRNIAEQLDDECAEKIRSMGCDIIELTPEQRDTFRRAVIPVISDIKSRVSPEIFSIYQEIQK
jgi:tripartite ATP-independent transporter DctP family solute receptor